MREGGSYMKGVGPFKGVWAGNRVMKKTMLQKACSGDLTNRSRRLDAQRDLT